MENIGEKIMQARKTKGMTQDTLAQLVNVSRQTVSHWENGRAMPDVATAAQLSKVLDVNFLADEAAEDAAVQPPEAVPTVQEPAQETQEQTDGRFVNPPEQPRQPNQRKRIAVICAAVVIIVAAVIAIVLPMMPKAAQVAGLRQDGHGIDRADAGDRCQQLIVRQIREELDRTRLDLVALTDKTSAFGKDQTEHADGVGIWVHRQSDRVDGCRVNI